MGSAENQARSPWACRRAACSVNGENKDGASTGSAGTDLGGAVCRSDAAVRRSTNTPCLARRGMSCGRPMRNRLFPAAAAALFLTALAVPAAHAKGGDAPVTEAELAGHIRILASDAFEGRAPGTGGEDRTLPYIVGEWAKA